jgi:hypothetical protein
MNLGYCNRWFHKLPINGCNVLEALLGAAAPHRLSLTINREIENAIFEGARNARGGERQFAAGRGLAELNLHLFEPVQLLL